MATMRLVSTFALFAALTACSNPTPRSYADPGVSYNPSRGSFNAPYYTGADPSFRPRGGGSN